MSSTDLRQTAVRDAVADSWFCTLATTSAEGRPHVAGVLYALVDRDLYVHTDRTSRKARNIVANPNVAVCVPVAAAPGAPPNTVSLQARAALVAVDDAEITSLIAGGRLAAITSHGELERSDTCFVRITPGRRVAAYGIGVSEADLAADPLNALGAVAW